MNNKKMRNFIRGVRVGARAISVCLAAVGTLAVVVKTFSETTPEEYWENTQTIIQAVVPAQEVVADEDNIVVMTGYYYGNGVVMTEDGNVWEYIFEDGDIVPDYMAKIHVEFNTHGNESVEDWEITGISPVPADAE